MQPKIGLMKKEKPNRPNCHKKSPKIEPKQLKIIWPELNPIIARPLHNLTSISHIFLISTLNCDSFEALDFRLPKLQNHIWFTKKIL